MECEPGSSSSNLDPEPIRELARRFWESAVLRAGIKLDVFSFLDSGGRTSAHVARHIGAAPRYVQAFLDSCVVLGLLQAGEEGYSLAPLTSQFLVKGRKEYVGDQVLHHTNTWAS